MFESRSKGRRAARELTAALVSLWLVGCGGTMAFSDQSALVIVGDPPKPAQLKPKPKPKPKPPPEPKRVEVTAGKIMIRDKILFESGKSTIREESHGLLDEIAGVLRDNAHIREVSIEGHTDADGNDKYNQKLSDGRAGAVRAYLEGKGIEAGRLTSKGFGESKPIADNETDEGKEKNRRVEFIITKQDEVKQVYEVDPKTGKRREVEGGK
ncbi:MAG: OmpA family protein [Myxococcales bacterium]|nr:OmpA family protein [Myxococcales bacterium]